VLRIFSPLKIRWLRPGLNPRTWVLKASTLPLDHRSRYEMKNLKGAWILEVIACRLRASPVAEQMLMLI